MSVTTIYKCDKCGNEEKSSGDFWNVGISANPINYSHGSNIIQRLQIQICRQCLESFGIKVHKKPNVAPGPTPPTIEELITEIVAIEVKNHIP